MKSLIRALFAPPPKIGERFCLYVQRANPFNRATYTVTVTDVREGWVQYEYQYGGRSAMSRFDFYVCYDPVSTHVTEQLA
jgi:hypothetical protein